MNQLNLIKELFKIQSNLNIYFLNSLDYIPNIDKELRLKISSDNLDGIKQYFSKFISSIDYKKIYMIKDIYKVMYTFFKVRKKDIDEYIIIGPYLIDEIKEADIKNFLTKNNLLKDKIEFLKSYYDSLPFTYKEVILKSSNSILKNIYNDHDKYEIQYYFEPLENHQLSVEFSEEIAKSDIEVLESRYRDENSFLNEILKGDTKKAINLYFKFQKTLPQIEYFKCIESYKTSLTISNVLIRKTVEKTGVHPYFINKLSRKFAKIINTSKSRQELKNLVIEMIKEYCDLVNNNRVESFYSPIVKDTIFYINLNLLKEFSLKDISEALNVNKNYLSGLFKKETGLSITKYHMGKRMNHAKKLIENTNLLISDISQIVGIYDAGYFTKLFKKTFGVTPREYKNKVKLSKLNF